MWVNDLDLDQQTWWTLRSDPALFNIFVNNLVDRFFKNPLITCLSDFELGGVKHDMKRKTRRGRENDNCFDSPLIRKSIK